jgi:hypothetical protein
MPPATSIRTLLAIGRHRLSLGRIAEVVDLVCAHPRRVEQLMECLWDDDQGVVNRAAQAAEELSRYSPALVQPWKTALLGLLAEATENKLRWSLALIVPRLHLSAAECQRAAAILHTYLEDPSSIVKTFALQGLADLARQDPALGAQVLDLLRLHSRSGTPAMRARCRILLKAIEQEGAAGTQ